MCAQIRVFGGSRHLVVKRDSQIVLAGGIQASGDELCTGTRSGSRGRRARDTIGMADTCTPAIALPTEDGGDSEIHRNEYFASGTLDA